MLENYLLLSYPQGVAFLNSLVQKFTCARVRNECAWPSPLCLWPGCWRWRRVCCRRVNSLLFWYIQPNFLIPGASSWYSLLGWRFLWNIYRLKGLSPFFQFLLGNPFCLELSFVQKRRKVFELFCCSTWDHQWRKKKQLVLCSSVRCHTWTIVLWFLASYQCYAHRVLEWVQTNRILRSRSWTFSKEAQHCAGDAALPFGKHPEEIQASRNLENFRSVSFCHSSHSCCGQQKRKWSSLHVVSPQMPSIPFAESFGLGVSLVSDLASYFPLHTCRPPLK